MATIQKAFLKRVKQRWKTEFPFLCPVELDEIPRLPKGSRYLCRNYASERGVYYFIRFNIFQKRAGEFSLDIVVSPSEDESIMTHAKGEPTPTNIGELNIARYLKVQSYEWALVDIEANIAKFFKSLGGEELMPAPPRKNVWRPTSFDLPAEQIIDEAIDDINAKLRTSVFPQLDIHEDVLREE